MFSLNCLLLQVTMSGDWVPWSAKVPQVEVETHKVGRELCKLNFYLLELRANFLESLLEVSLSD